jgi:hypothetical protein
MHPAPDPIDALFVINQDTDLHRLAGRVRKAGFRRGVILSSHHLFTHERKIAAERMVAVHTFADLLTDAEMAACDDRATEKLRPARRKEKNRGLYTARFMQASRGFKNRLVLEKLRQRYRIGRIFFHPGLGIAGDCWKEAGGVSLEQTLWARVSAPARRLFSRVDREWGRFKQWRGFYRVSDGSGGYLFLSPVERLKLSDRVAIRPVRIPLPDRLRFHLFPGWRSQTLSRFQRRAGRAGKPLPPATTIHEYRPEFGRLDTPLYVFLDGYHPENYPRSYLDSFSDTCIFVFDDPISSVWFKKFGRPVCPAPSFFSSPRMATADAAFPGAVDTVLLALNHAGDWTALINRSDTDRLVEAFIEVARQVPDADFVIRPHPTMAAVEHEGTGAMERIRSCVAGQRLANLSVSRVSLGEDLARADLVVSEYSQVLIDAFRSARLGLIANLTNRRSFMPVYEALGFPAVHDGAALIHEVVKIRLDVPEAVKRQNRAAEAYNRRFVEEGQ